MAGRTETVKEYVMRSGITGTVTGRIGPDLQRIKRATPERLAIDDKANRKSELICKHGGVRQLLYKGWVATLSPSGVSWFIILGPYYVDFPNHWEFEAFVDDTDATIAAIIDARP